MMNLGTIVNFYGIQQLTRLLQWREVPRRLRIPSIVSYTKLILEPTHVLASHNFRHPIHRP